jgi:hypothetical protein
MLYTRRKRNEALAAAEASGKSFWTKKFAPEVRVKVLHALNSFADDIYGARAALALARQLILYDEGWMGLGHGVEPVEDMLGYIREAPDDTLPTIIEALYQALVTSRQRGSWGVDPAGFTAAISGILAEHRVSFDFVDGTMVEFTSRELHQEVVEPTLRLLGGQRDLAKVEAAYQKALRELSAGAADDAITDAATALQEMLIALGCEGKALGPLLGSAKKKGLLAAHDAPLIDWVSADRSQFGDAHRATSPTREDAWLTVHVVGALALRLAKGRRAS